MFTRLVVAASFAVTLAAGVAQAPRPTAAPADLVLVNGRAYTLAWADPDPDGRPSAGAPHGSAGWHPDAQAVAIRGRQIVFVGSNDQAQAYKGASTRLIDLAGATVLPGLVDSHVHVVNLGASLERVNLMGVPTEAEAVTRVEARSKQVPKGQWIVGWGWDEGAWANHYPDMKLLSERVPDHPVVLSGLHSYAVWGNRLAFERAGITRDTPAPSGGEIRKGPDGEPSGILVNNAGRLLTSKIPAPTPQELDDRIVAGMNAMAKAGYVSVAEAGADSEEMAAFERLEKANRLPIRMYAMLSARDAALLDAWEKKGPDPTTDRMLVTRSVKAFYDGALGSRGARLLADYADRPGERGTSGAQFGFDQQTVAAMMRRGFQVAVHAIGDAANRETLDFFERTFKTDAPTRALRHRIEHAQVLAPSDIARFKPLDIIASMEPSHATEDMGWAEARLGPERVKGAYAWRRVRRTGARMVLNSDLPGTDYDIFYGWHSAVTRQDKQGQPPGGWYPDQRLTPEEAVRGYTSWAAYAAFAERETGVLAPGRWADVTVVDIDPLVVGSAQPAKLLDGKIRMTIVGGNVVYESRP